MAKKKTSKNTNGIAQQPGIQVSQGAMDAAMKSMFAKKGELEFTVEIMSQQMIAMERQNRELSEQNRTKDAEIAELKKQLKK